MKTAFLILGLFLTVMVYSPAQDKPYYGEKIHHNNYDKHEDFSRIIDFENIDYQLLHASIFYATNKIREKKRLDILTYHPLLEESAQMHSRDMVEQDFFAHINPKKKSRKTPEDRLELVGASNPYPAENIATEFGLQYTSGKDVYIKAPGVFTLTPEGDPIPPHTYYSLGKKVVDEWMNSPPHRKNILRKDALQLGCGAWFYINHDFNDMPTFMFTQNFQLYEALKKK